MDLTETTGPSAMNRWSILAAFFAGSCNLLSLIFVNYQNYLRSGELVLNYPEIVSNCLLLSPLFVMILLRRVAAIAFSYALVLLVILVGRIYYLAQFYRVGKSAFIPTMDLPGMGLILLSGISLVIILAIVLILLGRLIDNVLKQSNGASRNG